MGYIMSADETGDKELHVEVRRESVVFSDDYYPWRLPSAPAGEQHVFVYGCKRMAFEVAPGRTELMNESASFEVSKEWLWKLLRFFDDNKNRERCGVATQPSDAG